MLYHLSYEEIGSRLTDCNNAKKMLILSYFLLLFAPPWLPGGGGGVAGGVGWGYLVIKERQSMHLMT